MATKRTKAAKTSSPFTKGRTTRTRGPGGFLQAVKEGEPITFAPLVGLEGLISADMHEYWNIKPAIYHPCLGRDCPGCAVGNDPRFKGYLPVLLQSGETAVYPFTISVYNQLEALEDALEDDETLKGLAIKVSRKGAGKATRYTVMGLGKRLDVDGQEIPDFIKSLGPTTPEDVWALLEENGYSRDGATPSEDDDEDGWGSV